MIVAGLNPLMERGLNYGMALALPVFGIPQQRHWQSQWQPDGYVSPISNHVLSDSIGSIDLR